MSFLLKTNNCSYIYMNVQSVTWIFEWFKFRWQTPCNWLNRFEIWKRLLQMIQWWLKYNFRGEKIKKKNFFRFHQKRFLQTLEDAWKFFLLFSKFSRKGKVLWLFCCLIICWFVVDLVEFGTVIRIWDSWVTFSFYWKSEF